MTFDRDFPGTQGFTQEIEKPAPDHKPFVDMMIRQAEYIGRLHAIASLAMKEYEENNMFINPETRKRLIELLAQEIIL